MKYLCRRLFKKPERTIWCWRDPDEKLITHRLCEFNPLGAI